MSKNLLLSFRLDEATMKFIQDKAVELDRSPSWVVNSLVVAQIKVQEKAKESV